MKRFIFTLMVIGLSISSVTFAQDEAKYLTGAVPEIDGKVVFSKTFIFPDVSQDAIYERIYPWLETKMKSNKNNSRITFTAKEKGQIVATGVEYLIFTSNALSLDRAKINYQVLVNCMPGRCEIQLERIRYEYQDNERYTAEEQISDKIALNKDKTKMHRGYKKFREKTVDFANNFFELIRAAFGMPEDELVPMTAQNPSSSMVVEDTHIEASHSSPKNDESHVVSKTTNISPATVTSIPITELAENINTSYLKGYKQIAPDKIPGNIIKMLNEDWMLITAGNDLQVNMMTASWGGIGRLYEKPVAICFINPTRYTYQLMEKNDTYTFSFYTETYREALKYCGSNSGHETDKVKGSGLTPITTSSGSKAFSEAWMIIECRKLIGQQLNHDALSDDKIKNEWIGKQLHKMYIGEIINVWVK